RLPRGAVTQRILDDRLEQQRRHRVIQAAAVDLVLYVEPIPEACLLELDVAVHPFDLGGQRHELLPRLIEIGPHEVAEIDKHLQRARVVAQTNERRNRVQRVEQEVRLDLQSKRVQLRSRELGLQARLVELELPRAVARR